MTAEQYTEKSVLSLPEVAELLLPPGKLSEEEMDLLELPYAQLLERAWEEIKVGDLETRRRWARIFLGHWHAKVIRYVAASGDSETSITGDGTIDFGEGETLNVHLADLSGETRACGLDVRGSTPQGKSRLIAYSEHDYEMPSVIIVTQLGPDGQSDVGIKYSVFIGSEREAINRFEREKTVLNGMRETATIDDGTLELPRS